MTNEAEAYSMELPMCDSRTTTPIGRAGDLWKASRGQPSYPRIGKAIKDLLKAHGPAQVLAAWEGYLEERQGKSFATPEDFAGNYMIYRDRYAVELDEQGQWKPLPDVPAA